MKSTIPASEIKRRGISAVEPALKHGPVEVISRNRPRYVILSPEHYQRLVGRRESADALWDELLAGAGEGTRSAADIRQQVQDERGAWRGNR